LLQQHYRKFTKACASFALMQLRPSYPYIRILLSSISRGISSGDLYCCWLVSCLFNAPNPNLSLVKYLTSRFCVS